MEVTGIVLAGGKSTRMGTDKGLLMLKGKTFVEHVCAALNPITEGRLLVVTNNEEYAFCKATLVKDVVLDKGPVSGIYSGLQQSTTDLNIIVSTDVPFISTEFLRWLLAQHKAPFDVTEVIVKARVNPLIAVYNKSVASIFYENLITNKLKLITVVEGLSHQTIDVPEQWLAQLANINTKEEYDNIGL